VSPSVNYNIIAIEKCKGVLKIYFSRKEFHHASRITGIYQLAIFMRQNSRLKRGKRALSRNMLF
jgi:hypothetical protein